MHQFFPLLFSRPINAIEGPRDKRAIHICLPDRLETSTETAGQPVPAHRRYNKLGASKTHGNPLSLSLPLS